MALNRSYSPFNTNGLAISTSDHTPASQGDSYLSTFFISVFATCAIDGRGKPVAAPDYPTVVPDHIVDVTVASVQSQQFSGHTRFIQFTTDTRCSFVISADPVATTINGPVNVGDKCFVGVQPGHRIAVISNP